MKKLTLKLEPHSLIILLCVGIMVAVAFLMPQLRVQGIQMLLLLLPVFILKEHLTSMLALIVFVLQFYLSEQAGQLIASLLIFLLLLGERKSDVFVHLFAVAMMMIFTWIHFSDVYIDVRSYNLEIWAMLTMAIYMSGKSSRYPVILWFALVGTKLAIDLPQIYILTSLLFYGLYELVRGREIVSYISLATVLLLQGQPHGEMLIVIALGLLSILKIEFINRDLTLNLFKIAVLYMAIHMQNPIGLIMFITVLCAECLARKFFTEKRELNAI